MMVSTSLAVLFNAHPSELTVLTLPTQLNARERYLIEATVKGKGINSCLVFDHINAYISRMTLTELTPDTRIFLFVEATPTNFIARLLNIRHQGSQRIQHPIRTHTVSGSSFGSLVELISQVIAWMPLQSYKLSRVVFLDILHAWPCRASPPLAPYFAHVALTSHVMLLRTRLLMLRSSVSLMTLAPQVWE